MRCSANDHSTGPGLGRVAVELGGLVWGGALPPPTRGCAWGSSCWETLGPRVHVDAGLTDASYLSTPADHLHSSWPRFSLEVCSYRTAPPTTQQGRSSPGTMNTRKKPSTGPNVSSPIIRTESDARPMGRSRGTSEVPP